VYDGDVDADRRLTSNGAIYPIEARCPAAFNPLVEDFPLLWSEDEVNPGEAFSQFLGLGIYQASGECDGDIRGPLLERLDRVQLVEHFVLGILPHHAAIEQDEVSFFGTGCRGITGVFQIAGYVF
jgi:hypothetical protein